MSAPWPLPHWPGGLSSGVDHRHHQRALGLGPVGKRVHVFQLAEEIGLLDHQRGIALAGMRRERLGQRAAAARVVVQIGGLHPLGVGGVAHHLGVVRMQCAGDQHAPAGVLAVGAYRHQQRLAQAAGAVVQGGVGDLHAGQAADHALVFVEHLQRALAGLGLVGRIGRVELAAGGDLPHRRRDMVLVGAGADEVQRRAVLAGAFQHELGDGHLRQPFRRVLQ
jgi:hypothetical protein